MYILKTSANTNNPVRITDSDYEDLYFWQKWKYRYDSDYTPDSKLVNMGQQYPYGNPRQPSSPTRIIEKTTYVDDSPSLLNTIIAAELINDMNQQQDIVNDDGSFIQPDQPQVEMGGGNFGGGGSSGSWADDNNQQQTTDDSQNFSLC